MLSHVFGVLALSLCSAFPSFQSSLISHPKRAFSTTSSINGTISIGCLNNGNIAPDITFSLNGYNSGNISGIDQGSQYYSVADGQGDIFSSDWYFSNLGSDSTITGALYLYFSDQDLFNVFVNNGSDYITYNNGAYDDGILDNGYDGRNYELELDWYAEVPRDATNYGFDIVINVPVEASYSVSANYVNCSHTAQSGEKYLPSQPYTSSTISNPYVFRVDASQGCRFRKDGSAVSTTGGININSILYDGLPASVGSDYATWIAIELNLPLADCSITFNAINQFAVNKNLDACTTTIPDVYSVDMTGTYRIEALSGYAFDSNLTQYTITGIVVNSVAYADNIYGHLYRTIVLDLTFPATNYANVNATASPYSADYAQGFKDGEASGLELKGGLMDLIPNVFASIGAFFFTFSGVNFMGINLLAIVGIVVSVGLIGVVIKVALK